MTEYEYFKALFRAASDAAYEATYVPAIHAYHVTERTEQLYLTLRGYNNTDLMFDEIREQLNYEASVQHVRDASAYHGGYES